MAELLSTSRVDVAQTAATSVPTPADAADYLLCIEGERSWTFSLPPAGEVIIGRSGEARLQLHDSLVSRAHAQLLITPDGLQVADLGSRHGTLLNGRRLAAPRLVTSGDVITIGGTLLVVHRPARSGPGRGLVDAVSLRQRLEEEVERALHYQRELSLVLIRSPAALDRPRIAAALAGGLRPMDAAAFLGDCEIAIVLPEIGDDEADEVTAALLVRLAEEARAGGAAPEDGGRAGHRTQTSGFAVSTGVAVSPHDGCDVDTLLAGAGAAAEQAAAGAVVRARDATYRIRAGAHELALADPAMLGLYELVRRLARSLLPVLIQGETGVGKELAAAAVHAFSPRSSGPFVSINCAAIPESLAESELFGHERGAFSGAVASKLGRLEVASGGTVFLDEIGDLPMALQAKLLRVLETGELTRIGDVKVRIIDVRVVAATHRDLAAAVDAGTFRRDLFFRLGAAQVVLPPLRDRPRDLALLTGHFLEQACVRLGRRPLMLSVAATQALFRHRWPGNVRELRNAMEYAAATAPDSALEIDTWHLPPTVAATRQANAAVEGAVALDDPTGLGGSAAPTPGDGVMLDPGRFRPIADEVRELERARMIAALAATGGVQNRAAELIEMPLRTFVTKLKRYAISAADWSRPR